MSCRTIVADPPDVVDENFDPLAMKWRAVVVLVVAVAVFDILVAAVGVAVVVAGLALAAVFSRRLVISLFSDNNKGRNLIPL